MTFQPTRILLIAIAALIASTGLAQTQVALNTPPTTDATLHTRQRYTLRAGDAVTLDYRYTPEYNQTVTVQPDGFVNLTIVGEQHIAGMTLDQFHTLVVDRAGTKLNQPEVNISLKEFEKPFFVVSGEVDKPGRFDFYEKTTALQAVMLAGGFKGSAQQSDVYIFRRVNGDLAEVHKVNLHKIKKTGDLEHDLILEPGDMLLVPASKLEHVSRFIKATNLSVYFNPLEAGLF